MRKALASAFLLYIFLFSQGAIAQQSDIRPEVRRLGDVTLLAPDDDVSKPEFRKSVVAALSDYCISLERAFPKNSPLEEQWLENELAGDGQRFERAVNSPEMGRRQAHYFVEQCRMATQTYLQPNGNKTQSIFMLIYAISRFEPDNASRWAQRNGLDPNWGFYVLSGSIRKLSLMGAAMTQSPPLKGWTFEPKPASR